MSILVILLIALGASLLALILIFVYIRPRYRPIHIGIFSPPGEAAFRREEAVALENMDDMQRMEYMRAKAFVLANPLENGKNDITLSQFLAIQEKGVSAWEFEPEPEVATCFVESRTQIEFFDSQCSVQSNLPIPKQNQTYYFETKIYEKQDNTLISIGLATKPYPLFRLPGFHRHSIAYLSDGTRRYNQPFLAPQYAPTYQVGDVIGVGYSPRKAAIFFTHNGRKFDEVVTKLVHENFFPTIGATGICNLHVNLGQLGFVFIEANVKKWGLAPASGSLAPPPPYGDETGSILLEYNRVGTPLTDVEDHDDAPEPSASHQHGVSLDPNTHYFTSDVYTRRRSGSQKVRRATGPPPSPGPSRPSTDISLDHFQMIEDPTHPLITDELRPLPALRIPNPEPPAYTSPSPIPRDSDPLLPGSEPSPPIPTYEAAVATPHGQ